MRRSSRLVLLLAFAFSVSASSAQEGFAFEGFGGPQVDEPVSLSAYFEVKEDSRLGKIFVEATVESGWHLYSVTQPKGGPIRSTMTIAETDDFRLIGPWTPDQPAHVEFSDIFGVDVEQHDDFVVWEAPVEFAEGFDYESATIVINFYGQSCKVSCIQIDEELEAAYEGVHEGEVVAGEFPVEEVAGKGSTTEPKDEPKKVAITDTPEQLEAMAKLYDPTQKIKTNKGATTFLGALVGFFLGGLLLNLMPCVFPVLGIKVMGFVEQAGSDPKKIKLHGLAFAAGLIFSMWVLAGIILGIKAYTGEEVNWGQQMGEPIFLGAIVLLLFVLGLNMAGVFEIGLFMTKVGSGKQKGYTGSFLSGIITTVVATPCSGPFLGAAMGYTFAQSATVAMFLFTVFGIGIAFPYVVLAFFPAAINMLPRPGAWMETFKKLMGFTLFAAAAFFVKAFGTLTGVDGLSWFLMALCVVSLAAFFYGKYSPAYIKASTRYLWGWAVPLLVAGLGLFMTYQASQLKAPKLAAAPKVEGHLDWKPWVPGRVESLLAEGKSIWVDYTADW